MRKYNTQKNLSFPEAKEKALTYLEYRIHSQKELSQKLKRAGANDEDIEKIMLFLKEYKLIDDRDYAIKYANDLKNLKKYAKKRIYQELILKGIDKEIIEEVLSNMEATDINVLSKMIEKRLRGNFDNKNKERILRYFIYRGYNIDEIKTCIYNLENTK